MSIRKVRQWLIGKLAGDDIAVIANVSIIGGYVTPSPTACPAMFRNVSAVENSSDMRIKWTGFGTHVESFVRDGGSDATVPMDLADVVHEAVERAKADLKARQPVTLTEFLLARIAEDEEAAHDEAVREQRYPVPAGAAYALTLADTFTTARVLAECEAKRRIVELHDGAHECSQFDRSGEIDNCTWVLDDENCSTVRLLALPYADHPEFDPSWGL